MKIRAPQVQVWLYKLRDRQALGGSYSAPPRFKSVRNLDVTPYLADAGLRTQRSLRDPSGGTFQIVFDDKPLPNGFGDSLYGLIEPGDFIEIRAAGLVKTLKLPLLMRGFVKSVDLDEDISSGSPNRQILVSGVDVAHVLQLLRVRYSSAGITPDEAAALTAAAGIPFGTPALAAFEALTQWTGSTGQSMEPVAFIGGVITNLIQPYLNKLFSKTPVLSGLTSLSADCSITSGIVPALMGAGAFDGRSVYEVLAQALDVGVFNELYLQDNDTELKLIARPLPWRDASGAAIGGATPADDYPVDIGSLIRGRASRNDAGVANYFWVQRSADLLNDNTRRLVGASGPSQDSYLLNSENTNPTAFGWRFMEVQTALTLNAAAIMSPTADQNQARSQSEEEWLTARRQTLMALNADNVVWESGILTLMGDEALKPGVYVLMQRGKSAVRMYVDTVAHQYSAAGFITTANFTRGTGWLERASSTGMPWYEWRNENGVS